MTILGVPSTFLFTALDQILPLPSSNEPALVHIQVIGAGTLSLQLEDSYDGGVTYAPVRLLQAVDGAQSIVTALAGLYRQLTVAIMVSGRIRCSSYTSGTMRAYAAVNSIR